MDYKKIFNEDIQEGNHKPVFIILTEGKTPLISKGISFFTNSPITHCSISFDKTLRKIYSFNFGKSNSGFIEENLFRLNRGRKIHIYCLFLDDEKYKKVKRSFNDFYRNREKTKYSFSRLFLKIFNKGAEKNKYSQVCSSFVFAVLYNAGIYIGPTDIKLVSPAEIDKTINMNKTVYKVYEGVALDIDIFKFINNIDNLYKKASTKEFENNVSLPLNEGIQPNEVDKSHYNKFNLFGLFNIYTTDFDLETNETFIRNMRWVKDRLEEIAEEAHFKLIPYDLTLCASFDDLNVFYDGKAPWWVTGFTWGNEVYMKSPNIYKGKLYYNVVLHEAIHVMLWNNIKVPLRITLDRGREEGFAVFFSTGLKDWLRELNHNGANWYYYENAIEIQDRYLNGGMDEVLEFLKKR